MLLKNYNPMDKETYDYMAEVQSKIASNIRGAKSWYAHYDGCKKIYFIHSALLWHSGYKDHLKIAYLKSLGIKNSTEAMEKALIYAKAIRYLHYDNVLVN